MLMQMLTILVIIRSVLVSAYYEPGAISAILHVRKVRAGRESDSFKVTQLGNGRDSTRLCLSVSKVPALLPHTKLPLSGRGRARVRQMTPVLPCCGAASSLLLCPRPGWGL